MRAADHDAARVQVIIQRPALAQKLRREQQPCAAEPAHDALRIADRHRGFDDHERAGVDPADEREHRLDGRGVEEVALGVIVRRRGNDDHVGRAVGPLGVHGRRERQRLRAQEVCDLGVDDRRDAAVDLFGFGGGRGHGGDGVVLREQHRLRQANIAHTGYGNVHLVSPVSQVVSLCGVTGGKAVTPKCHTASSVRCAPAPAGASRPRCPPWSAAFPGHSARGAAPTRHGDQHTDQRSGVDVVEHLCSFLRIGASTRSLMID